MTVTLEGNECSQQGATIEIPAVAAHVSGVPPGVELPSSPSDTFRPPAPTAHPRRLRPRAVAQPKRSGKSLSAKVLLGNLISG